MTNPLTPAQFYAADGVGDWRVEAVVAPAGRDSPAGGAGGNGAAGADPRFTARATFATGSFSRGVRLVDRIGEIADAADHHPDVDLTYPSVAVSLTTHDAGGSVTAADAEVARDISAAARELGIAAEGVRPPIRAEHLELLGGRKLGTLATVYRDGRPQLSNVTFHHADGVIRVSVTDSRVKVRNVRRDARATMHVTGEDGWSWVAAEGVATLGPATRAPDDEAADDLVDLYRAVAGEHPDWTEFRDAMVAEERLVLRLIVVRTYGAL